MSRTAKAWLGAVLRLLVSLALLIWLGTQLRGGFEQLRAVDPWSLVPAAVVFTLSTILGAWQWILILRRAGVEATTARLHGLYWMGLFFNNFLPSSVGGDVVKVADLAVSTGRVARPVAGTVLDRMLGLSALVLLAFVAGGVLGGRTPAGLPWWALTVLTVPVLALSLAILSGRLGRLLVMVRDRIHRGPARSRLRSLLDELQAYRAHPGFVLRLGALALVVQALRVATHVLVAGAMGIPIDPVRILQLYVLVPVLGVAMLLPLSFNGLGVREFVATRLMPQIGIDAEAALALQLTTYLVQLAVSLVGGVVFTVRMARGGWRWRRPTASEESPPER